MEWIKNITQSLRRITSSGKYLPFVDGMRFLAIMPVILMHANERLIKYNPALENLNHWETELSYYLSRGAIGVMIFFTLSGFILSIPFAKQKAFSYKIYIGRRLTRLEPPYIFWMSCFALIFMVQNSVGFNEMFRHFLASLTYTHNIVYSEFSTINPVAWSLEVEVQYYLIAPFLAILYFNQSDVKFRRSALIVFIVFFITYQHAFGWQYQPIKASILGYFQHFLVGLLMADLYVHAPKWCNIKSYIWDILAPLFLIVLAFSWTEEYGKSVVFSIAMAGLFLAAFKGKIFPKLLSIPFISIVGGMCYTIYLTHLPLLELLGSFTANLWQSSSYIGQLSKFLILAVPIVLLSSAIFYKAIEKPFMKKNAFQKSLQRLKILN